MRRPRWFFVHVMRCGGTSLRELLWRHIEQSRVWPNAADLRANGGSYPEHAEALALPSAFFSTVDLVAGHYPLVLADHFPSRPRTITFLRDPVARSISHLRRWRQLRDDLRDRSDLQLLDDRRLRLVGIADHQTRYFAFRSLAERDSVNRPLPVDAARLELAKERLATVDVVGILERFDASLAVARARLGLDVGAPVRVNTTGGDGEIDDAVRERLLELTTADRELYRYGRQLLDQALNEVPRDHATAARRHRART